MNFRRTTPIISNLVILIILLTTVAGAETIRSLDDLDGKRIAVALGSFQEKLAEQKYKNAKILAFPSFSDCANAVLANKADACLFNSDVKNDLLKARPELTALPESAYDFTCAAAFRKGDVSLRTEFNAFLRKIRDDGTYPGNFTRPLVHKEGRRDKMLLPHKLQWNCNTFYRRTTEHSVP